MRRDSNFLKKDNLRSGMAMIMAIGFLVIIAGLLASMLNMSSVTTKRTEHMYFKEQAQLLAKSATEFALLAISGHNRIGNTNCITTINSQFPANAPYFDINATIRYIGLRGAVGGGCDTYITEPFVPTGNNVAPESEGTVMIDIYVSSIENAGGAAPGLQLGQAIRYHRRTLQKP